MKDTIKNGLLNPDMSAQSLRLHMGELTASEARAARAAIAWANSMAGICIRPDIDIGYTPKEIISQCSFEFFSDGTCAYRGTEGFEKLVLAELTPSPDTELLAAKEAVILAAQDVVMADVYKYPFLSRADAVKQGVDRLHDAVKRLAFIQIHGEAAIAKHSGRE